MLFQEKHIYAFIDEAARVSYALNHSPNLAAHIQSSDFEVLHADSVAVRKIRILNTGEILTAGEGDFHNRPYLIDLANKFFVEKEPPVSAAKTFELKEGRMYAFSSPESRARFGKEDDENGDDAYDVNRILAKVIGDSTFRVVKANTSGALSIYVTETEKTYSAGDEDLPFAGILFYNWDSVYLKEIFTFSVAKKEDVVAEQPSPIRKFVVIKNNEVVLTTSSYDAAVNVAQGEKKDSPMVDVEIFERIGTANIQVTID